MEQVVIRAEGFTGIVELLETKIKIIKSNQFGKKSSKEILIKDISAIQFATAGKFLYGYIRFIFKGGDTLHGPRKYKTLKTDENTVCFGLRQSSAFEKLKDAIDRKMALTTEGVAKTSNLDDLEKLAGLRDKGVITEEEFEAKKKQLLGL